MSKYVRSKLSDDVFLIINKMEKLKKKVYLVYFTDQ